jgi:beta-glucosidase
VNGLELERGFAVTTGLECSAPVVAGGLRQDELLLTGHWQRYRRDFALIAQMGMRYVRWGVPFHVVAADPERLDWRWTERALGALLDAGLEPIVDLLHFGLPDWLWGMGDPRLPAAYRRYVEAFVARFPQLRYYTPVNEPWISCAFSALEGYWNERRRDAASMVSALDRVLTCNIEGMAIIRAARPDAIFLQSDVCERWLADPADERDRPAVEAEVALRNEQRFIAYELSYGRQPGALGADWLLRNGMSERRLAWLVANGSDEGCIVGHDYYIGNVHRLVAPGRWEGSSKPGDFADLAREYHARLGLPMFLAETNREASAAPAWLSSVWNDTVSLVEAGLPMRGFCWYSLTDQVDWDTMLAEVRGTLNTVGLVDLQRRYRPVGHIYAALAGAARDGQLLRLGPNGELPLASAA